MRDDFRHGVVQARQVRAETSSIPLMASRSSLRVSRLAQIQQMLQSVMLDEIGELTDRLGVSEATVRRDLDALQRSGLVQRTHGRDRHRGERAAVPRRRARSQKVLEKKATSAARLIRMANSGDTVFDRGRLRDIRCSADAPLGHRGHQLDSGRDRAFSRPERTGHCRRGSVRTPELSLVGPRGCRRHSLVPSHDGLPGRAGSRQRTRVHCRRRRRSGYGLRLHRHDQRLVALADHTKLGRVSTRRSFLSKRSTPWSPIQAPNAFGDR